MHITHNYYYALQYCEDDAQKTESQCLVYMTATKEKETIDGTEEVTECFGGNAMECKPTE